MPALPRTARQLVQRTQFPFLSSFRRQASCVVSTKASPPVPDVESESGLAGPVLERDSVRMVDPRRRASRRDKELPHSRYQWHPPKFYRGPLHPIQPPPSSDPVARDFIPGPFNLPRLVHTYHDTIASDIMTLAYTHVPPGTPDKPPRVRLRSWGDETPYMANRPKRGPRGAEVLYPLEEDITWRNIPRIKAVHVATFAPLAKKNPDHLRVIRAVLQNATGVRPRVTAVKTSVAQWGIVKGDRAGAKVSLYGNQAYEFLDKVIHLVFPRIKEWQGIKGSTGDSAGNLSFGLSPTEMMLMPEIEANYSMYPAKMIPGCRIFIVTTAKSDRHARLLFYALGVPFHGKLVD